VCNNYAIKSCYTFLGDGIMDNTNYDVFRACAAGNIEYIKKYILNGMNPNVENEVGWTLLNLAVEHDRKEIVQFLLESGVNINFQSSCGWTPLHQAVDLSIDGTIQTGGAQGDEPTDMIKYLLDNGADINLMDSDGRSSIDIAKMYNSKKIIHFLKHYKKEGTSK
jgi:ankyrin repeat protein